MELQELLAHFDSGGGFGDDPEVIACMRACIEENRRLLFEVNYPPTKVSGLVTPR